MKFSTKDIPRELNNNKLSVLCYCYNVLKHEIKDETVDLVS